VVEDSVSFDDPELEFSITADNKEIGLLTTELTRAIQEPELYYPDFLQDAFEEMKEGITEICSELKSILTDKQ